MSVKQVSGEAGLARALSEAGAKLCVVDFYADWCGPCKAIAPEIERMSAEYADVQFLKVNEKDSADAMMARQIRAFPTFHLYLKNSRIADMTGANPVKLRELIDKHKPNSAPSFSGAGMTVGGGAPTASRPEDVREARLRALGVAGGSSGSSGPRATPTPTPAPKAVVALDATALSSLVDMGFGEVRAAKALLACGGKGVEAAMEWLAEHQDEAGVDEPNETVQAALRQAHSFKQPSSGAAAPVPAEGATGDVEMSDGTAGGGEAAGGAATAEELAEAQAAADAEATEAEAAGGAPAPKKRLTVEEAQARVKAIREAKAAKAKEEARTREIARREDGKKSAEMQDAIRAQQKQAELDKFRREKEFTEKERQRQLVELWKDKAERESRQHGKVSEETAAKLKALQEGKPAPLALDPKEAISKAVAALTVQKRESVGKVAAETLLKLLGNPLANPGEDKFRELKYSMKVFKDRLAVAPPSITILLTVGFVKSEGADGPVFRMSREHAEGGTGQELLRQAIQQIQQALDAKAFD